jgi:hypothetical protein
MSVKNYWGYRIDTSHSELFYNELLNGRLRQGWGYDEGQNLRNLTPEGTLLVDDVASRNLAMLNYVKNGDILLVPRLPDWDHVAIVEATEDWVDGYKFEFPEGYEDYAHIFPAKLLGRFVRYSPLVTGNIRSTLRNVSRFWNINHYANDIENLISSIGTEKGIERLEEWQANYARMESTVNNAFYSFYNDKDFTDKVYADLNEQFSSADWEHALTYGLSKLFPTYKIERTGGPSEIMHGTDILVRIPGLFGGSDYGIAIQVKDYEGFVNSDPVEQICKADDYWLRENTKIIDKIVLVTKASREENEHLKDEKRVRFIFSSDLRELLLRIGKAMIGLKEE